MSFQFSKIILSLSSILIVILFSGCSKTQELPKKEPPNFSKIIKNIPISPTSSLIQNTSNTSEGIILINNGTINKKQDPSSTTKKSKPSPVICAMDAKKCPDGSFVSRQAPDCKFAPCPNKK